jgi:hypothetical protein
MFLNQFLSIQKEDSIFNQKSTLKTLNKQPIKFIQIKFETPEKKKPVILINELTNFSFTEQIT